MNTQQDMNMYTPNGFDFRSIGVCFITLMLSNVPPASLIWLDATMKALASVAAISTITYNGVKLWIEVMGKDKIPKNTHRKPLKK